MNGIKIILFIFFISQWMIAQSIEINNGSSIYVSLGADICAGEYGNITGNLFGEGMQCGEEPLPVELVSFNFQLLDMKVQLHWQTATEVNNFGFDIERNLYLTNGITGSNSFIHNWEKIGFIEGYGNSNSPKYYSFTDNNPFGVSKFLYRLKQIDTNGRYEYSNTIEVEIIPDKYVLYQNYPNPFNPITKIRYQLPVGGYVVIKIFDMLGSEMITLLNEKKSAGIYELEFNAQSLSSGTYVYRIISGNFVGTNKMILLR